MFVELWNLYTMPRLFPISRCFKMIPGNYKGVSSSDIHTPICTTWKITILNGYIQTITFWVRMKSIFAIFTNKIFGYQCVGYIIKKTYTSLSGFSSREKEYANYGTLQLVLLAQYLQRQGFEFWNLGHPHMPYKKRLGCKVYSREEFLKRWQSAIER